MAESNDHERLLMRLNQLRTQFDASFADVPVTNADAAPKEYLTLTLRDRSFGIALDECRGLRANGVIVPVPSDVVGFMGVAGRGRKLVAVHDLCWWVLGQPRPQARWLLLDRNDDLAFAFDAFEAHHLVSKEDEVAGVAAGAARFLRQRAVRLSGQPTPIIDLPALAATLREQFGAAREDSGGT